MPEILAPAIAPAETPTSGDSRALSEPPPWSKSGTTRSGSARIKATAAMARATADDWRDAADLAELHRFCCDQINADERMAIATLDGVTATKTLEEIQRTLANPRADG